MCRCLLSFFPPLTKLSETRLALRIVMAAENFMSGNSFLS